MWEGRHTLVLLVLVSIAVVAIQSRCCPGFVGKGHTATNAAVVLPTSILDIFFIQIFITQLQEQARQKLSQRVNIVLLRIKEGNMPLIVGVRDLLQKACVTHLARTLWQQRAIL